MWLNGIAPTKISEILIIPMEEVGEALKDWAFTGHRVEMKIKYIITSERNLPEFKSSAEYFNFCRKVEEFRVESELY